MVTESLTAIISKKVNFVAPTDQSGLLTLPQIIEMLLLNHLIPALYQPVGKRQGFDVTQLDIVRHGAEQRDALADQDRDVGDNQLLNQPLGQKALNG